MGSNKENEMQQIQKGLEAFLQQELREMEAEESRQQKADPQLFSIEEEEEQEKELDIIGSKKSRAASSGKRIREDYYIEDWDSEEDIRPVSRGRSASAGRGRTSGGRSVPGESGRTSGSRSASGGSSRTSGDRSASGESGRTSGSRSASAGRSRASAGNRDRESQRRRDREDYYEEERESYRRSSRKAEKKRRRKKRGGGLRKFLIAVVLVIALLGGGAYFLIGNVYAKMNYEAVGSQTGLPLQEDGVVNILLIGNDSRENGEDGRSDAMILLSVSSKTKTIYMTSLLRDMYVEIPGHDGNRLNAAYSFGGAELLMETIEKNFDIPVNRYVLVNFEAFASLVDAVGGIELELTSEEIEYVNGYLVEYNILTNRPQGTDNMDTSVSGMVHLNGPQALAYCRNRYLGTDFGRTERQRKVLTAIIEKLPAAVVTNSGELIDGLMPNLTTNLTQTECFQLSLMAGKALTYDIVSDNIPQPGTYKDATIRKMAVLEVDFEANIKYLKEKLYGE